MKGNHRYFNEDTLVIASHNPGKVHEIVSLLPPHDCKVIAASELGFVEPDESGSSFVENACIKALTAAVESNCPALSDDSGLVVQALDGDPGIYSARWAGPKKDFSLAMQRVQDALAALEDEDPISLTHKAYFTSSLVLAWPDGHFESFEGKVHGILIWPPRGHKGFGYDPMFVPDGHELTFGEMDPLDKQAISHRARAFSKLVDACF